MATSPHSNCLLPCPANFSPWPPTPAKQTGAMCIDWKLQPLFLLMLMVIGYGSGDDHVDVVVDGDCDDHVDVDVGNAIK